MAYSGSSGASLFGEGGGGTLRLLAYLLLAVGLMVADHRGQHLAAARRAAGILVGPVYWLAGAPARMGAELHDILTTRMHLAHERDRLNEELLIARATTSRLEAVQRENNALRELLQGKRSLNLSVQLAEIVDVELDPFRHRVLISLGAGDGVREGLAVIDARGVFGQIVEVGVMNSTVLLVTDPSHAIPVQVQRSGLRTIAFGTGEPDRLHIPNIPQNADVRDGDVLLTSGIGGRFPAGLPVATVTAIKLEETNLFVEADAYPLASLDRSGMVLLVWSSENQVLDLGPPAPLDVEVVK